MLSFSIKPATAWDQALRAGGGGGGGRQKTGLNHKNTPHDVSPGAKTAAQESKLSNQVYLPNTKTVVTKRAGY